MTRPEWNSYTALITESPESPVRRVSISGKDAHSVRELVLSRFPRGRVLSVSLVRDATLEEDGSLQGPESGSENHENAAGE